MKNDNSTHGGSSGTLWKKKDLHLLAAALIAACLLFFLYRFLSAAPAAYGEVSVNGEVVAELDLNQDTSLTVSGWNGGSNTIVVQNGAISVTEATCPDHVCIHTGEISRTGETIVCLPNRLIITIIQDGG